MSRNNAHQVTATARRQEALNQYGLRHTFGKPHADRARQFMPFAALRGYYTLVQEAEKVIEPRRTLTDEEERSLNETITTLKRGQVVRCTYYEDNAYQTITGAVSQNDMIYGDLWIVRRRIPYDEICALTILKGNAL